MHSIKDVIRGTRLDAYVAARAGDVSPDDGNYRPQTPAPVVSGGTGVQDCPICNGVGFMRLDVPVGHPQFGRVVPCKCREREREAQRYRDHRSLSNLEHFVDATFATFDRDVPGTREAYTYAEQYSRTYEPIWMVLSGTYGCGKTHLAAAIANAAVNQQMTVLFAVVPDLLDQLRAAYAPNSQTTFDDRFTAIREVGVLVLDDLGTENTTEWAREKLFQIINYRMTQRLPLIVTTNNARWDKQNGGFAFPGVDDRIASRLSDVRMARHVHIAGEDYRRRQTGYTINTAPRPTPRRY